MYRPLYSLEDPSVAPTIHPLSPPFPLIGLVDCCLFIVLLAAFHVIYGSRVAPRVL